MKTKSVEKRETLKSIGIKASTKARLLKYANSQVPRQVVADVVSVAVDEYLDRHEAEKVS